MAHKVRAARVKSQQTVTLSNQQHNAASSSGSLIPIDIAKHTNTNNNTNNNFKTLIHSVYTWIKT